MFKWFVASLFLIILKAEASEVCVVRYVTGGATSVSCNGADYQLVSNQLSGVLQQKLDQKFDIKTVKTVGAELIYTLVKK